MAASLHIARYRSREAARMLLRMRRHRGTLDRTPGLAAARVFMTADFEPVFGGTPAPTRWALLCGWESGEARDDFLADEGAEPFLAGAREAWQLSLETVKVMLGDWRGWQPTVENVAPIGRDEPMVVLTHGNGRVRYMPAFHWHNRIIVREMLNARGPAMMLGLADHPLNRTTLSLWRSKGDAVRFAYGEGHHNPTQRHSLGVPWGKDYFFARFRPLTSSGTLEGRDPLAELRAVAPASA